MDEKKKLTGIDDVNSNRIPRCLYCGIPITPANDSGWEHFTGDGHTQPVCAWCEAEKSQQNEKASDDDKL